MGQDIHRAGHNPLPDDHLTFLRTTAFARGTVNSMRQQILLSWMRNADDADPVNALNNLLHEEQDDANTQVLVEPDANFGAPQRESEIITINTKRHTMSTHTLVASQHQAGLTVTSLTSFARCVVGGSGYLVVGYGTSMVGRVMDIATMVTSIAHKKYGIYLVDPT